MPQTHKTILCTTLFTVLLLSGCGAEISNELLIADKEFTDALPDRTRHSLEIDEDQSADQSSEITDVPSDWPEPVEGETEPVLLEISRNTAQWYNAIIDSLLTDIDTVRALPPNDRTENSRTWGPYDEDPYVQVIINRTEMLGTYDWSVDVSESEQMTDITPIFYGTHYAGSSVSEGDGVFIFDYTAASQYGEAAQGLLTVEYDTRTGRELLVEVAGLQDEETDESLSATSWYHSAEGEDAEGDFEYKTTYNADSTDPDILETLEVRTRWLLGGAGRSDAHISGGDLGDTEWWVTQCWDGDGLLTWQSDSIGALLPFGDESTCPYDDVGEVAHL